MLSSLALAAALVSQCSGGSCSTRGYSFQPFAPAYRQPAAPAASLYYLADATGKTWSSPDPAWLSTYVGQVNAQAASAPPMSAPRYYRQFTAPYASPCAGGSCSR